ncbi:PrsW family glutamic-type intramembrane protease [Corynebacterium ureicelerivorans]|uniref:PrsW family glutamic-type intramembrane protease n=1 Tax=Corynebacterium TaxID=1716 RepID=UPI0025B2AF04|nr:MULTISPECIES: PrsW family glutamic-type intramembrane protease [Corynebacterium]MDN8604487.1 PrsW family glutamic-type intramembrane protease [Corynebacterium ureicelerivorans]
MPWTPAFGAAAAAFVLISVAAAWLLLHRHPGRPGNPWWLPVGVIAGVGLGGVMPLVNSAYLDAAQQLPDVVTYLFSSIPEETAKLLAALLVIAAFAPVRRPVESAVVGMAVGAGFSVAEIVTNSAIKATLDLHSEYRDGAIFMLVMVVVGPFAHAVYTGLAAWGLGQFLCRTDQPLGWRLPRIAGWFLLAAALHGAFNAARMLPGVAGLVGAIAVTVLLWVLLIRLYRRSRALASQTSR